MKLIRAGDGIVPICCPDYGVGGDMDNRVVVVGSAGFGVGRVLEGLV